MPGARLDLDLLRLDGKGRAVDGDDRLEAGGAVFRVELVGQEVDVFPDLDAEYAAIWDESLTVVGQQRVSAPC